MKSPTPRLALSSSYTASEWKRVRRAGAAVEKKLRAMDLPLTQGGEPTFIPLNPAGAEWNTAALGPEKLDYSRKFIAALLKKHYPGALISHHSGKLYPGEPIPRWTILLSWRTDGKALWNSPDRLLQADLPGKFKNADAKRLMESLARKLGLAKHILTAFEEGPAKKIAGYALPLRHLNGTWVSDAWPFNDKTRPVIVVPGDSLIGLRLPLFQLSPQHSRSALTVESKNSVLEIFIPPLAFDSYNEIIRLLEDAVNGLNFTGIVINGYPPAHDSRVMKLGLASDPGVAEVNLPICHSWEEYDRYLQQLYAAADSIGLCAHKFNFNGRCLGTGGGAHVVFGGPEPLRSPFFTHPHLLPGIIRYWQRHPALSYFFTGQFMGPSSQAPRIDESTFEAMYELELSCAGAENLGEPPNVELFTMMFADLLMDRSGNTHRAEISVDKMWNTASPSGCLGLVEFRSFETLPNAQLMSVTGLFLRMVLAMLAEKPFREKFIRWGGELHDRFLIPSFLWQNIAGVVADLNRAGYPFELEWLRPIFDFRFPELGRLKVEGGEISVRQALETWPLLGEQSNGGGTSRSVDSSLERLEIRLSSPDLAGRGLLLANGYPVRFRRHQDVSAAAVRFKSFYVIPSLQPHVPVHSPILIEWVDAKKLVVLKAARCHSWRPGGGSYEGRPIDPKEARQRCLERWEPWHATEKAPRFIPAIDFPPEGTHTLDLRRYPAQTKA